MVSEHEASSPSGGGGGGLEVQESVTGGSLPINRALRRPPQFMNCVYPSAPVTITSIQILMASADGATT